MYIKRPNLGEQPKAVVLSATSQVYKPCNIPHTLHAQRVQLETASKNSFENSIVTKPGLFSTDQSLQECVMSFQFVISIHVKPRLDKDWCWWRVLFYIKAKVNIMVSDKLHWPRLIPTMSNIILVPVLVVTCMSVCAGYDLSHSQVLRSPGLRRRSQLLC